MKKQSVVVLWNRHGDGSLVAITNDAGLAARWKQLDSMYHHVRPMTVDDKALEKLIEQKEAEKQ
jgi:hypothetical protein